VHVRGRVIGGLEGSALSSPRVTLRWNDTDNTASVAAPIDVVLDGEQNFDISGVTAGPYLMIAGGVQDGMPLTGRVPINVGDADVANANIVVGAESKWTGKVRVDGEDAALPSGLTISLDPRRPIAQPAGAQVSENGEFTIPFVPDETYDLYVLNAPNNFYLKSVRVANAERLGQGLEAAASGAAPALDVILGAQGGQVVGRAVTADPKVVASGATIALLPDPPAGRVQAYQVTQADEYGNFILQGLPPGKYLLVGWLDQPPCEIYNPDDFLTCQAQGAGVTLAEGEQQSAQVTAN
jgi:hypothetical protein